MRQVVLAVVVVVVVATVTAMALSGRGRRGGCLIMVAGVTLVVVVVDISGNWGRRGRLAGSFSVLRISTSSISRPAVVLSRNKSMDKS